MFFSFLVLLFLCFFAYLSWRNLLWAAAFVVAFLPSYLIRFQIGPLPMTLLEAMVLILFVVWLIKIGNRKSSRLCRGLSIKSEEIGNHFKIAEFKNWRWLILLWLAIATISMFVSPDLRAAAGIWKAYFVEPILFLIVFVNIVKEKKDLDLIFYALGFSALYVSAFAIYQKFTGIAITNPIWQAAATRRVTSFYGYPNAVGLYLAPIVTLYFGWLVANVKCLTSNFQFSIFNFQTKFKIQNSKNLFVNCYLLLVTFTSIAAIVFARSEGACAGILAGLFFLGIFTKKLRWPTVAVSVILALAIFLIPQFKNRVPLEIKSLTGYVWQQITFQNDSGKVRMSQWQETGQMLKGRPLLGAGLAGYQETLAPYHRAKHIEIYLYPHNLFLNFWSELGLAGVITFILITIQFFYFGFKNSIGNRKSEIGNSEDSTPQYPNSPISQSPNIPLIAAMITLLVHGLVDVPYFKNDLSILFWLIIGLSLIQISEGQQNLTKSP